jgi:hypothetical protein
MQADQSRQFGRALSGHAGQGDLHQFADHRKREHASLIRNGGAKIRACKNLCVNSYTRRRREYGYHEGSVG